MVILVLNQGSGDPLDVNVHQVRAEESAEAFCEQKFKGMCVPEVSDQLQLLAQREREREREIERERKRGFFNI